MAKANVDPAELRRFARDMHRFNSDLQTMMSSLHARSQRLAGSWQDQEQQKFAEELDRTMKQLQRFMASSEDHTKFLLRKATQIEAYLGHQ